MLISPINISYFKNDRIDFSPSFQSKVTKIPISQGILKKDTSLLIGDILHAYRDIFSKLELKTKKGLEIIAQKYPDIRIGDTLGFRNCGENKNFIIINVGKMAENKNLIYLSRREGGRGDKEHHLLEAFLLDGNNKLVKNFEKEYSTRFPVNKEYYTQEEIDKLAKEEQLNKLLYELDFAMLKFRKFLSVNMDDNLKLPDGKIPYQEKLDINHALKICYDLDESCKNLHQSKMFELHKGFPQYCALPGLSSYMFKDLGEDKVTINFSKVNKPDEDLKRLSVYDEKGKPVKSFLIENDEKFVSNLKKKDLLFIPEKYSYADTRELEEKFLPEFKMYFQLYMDKLLQYKEYIDDYFRKEEDKKKVGKLSTECYFALKDSEDLLKRLKDKFAKFDSRKVAKIKKEVGELNSDFKEKGLWFNDKEQNKTVQLLLVNNKRHDDLCRITIIDNETNEKQMYLIKNFTYIVKNYNQNIPENIPPKLFYANIADVEDANLQHCCRFIKAKLEELNDYVDYEFERRNLPKKQKDSQIKERKPRSPKSYEEKIIKDCKKQFKDALNHLDLGFENFSKALQEIQEKIANIYKNDKKF